jgi:DNA-3-methyladenine glycosylase II
MRRLIDEYGPLSIQESSHRRPGDPYGVLVRTIVGQQLSTRAAQTIFQRLLDLFGGHTPSPRELIDADPDAVRAVGLSRSKGAYLRYLAERVEDGELELDRLSELPDDEVAAQLTAVKGIGKWSADMFLMFHLGRPDVLPVGDLGIRKAVERLYELPAVPDAAEVERIAEPWRPHRTLASLYLWTSLEAVPV